MFWNYKLDLELSKKVLDFGMPSPDGNGNPEIQKAIFSCVFEATNGSSWKYNRKKDFLNEEL